jgi:hypothetical protein
MPDAVHGPPEAGRQTQAADAALVHDISDTTPGPETPDTAPEWQHMARRRSTRRPTPRRTDGTGHHAVQEAPGSALAHETRGDTMPTAGTGRNAAHETPRAAPDTRHMIRGAGRGASVREGRAPCRTPDAGHRTPVTGRRTQDAGHRTPVTGRRARNGCEETPDAGCHHRRSDAGRRTLRQQRQPNLKPPRATAIFNA